MHVDVSIIDSFDALKLHSNNTLEGCLRVGVSKTVSGPSYFYHVSELAIQEVLAEGVLIQDIIVVANSFIVLHPSTIGYFQLSLFN